MSSIARVGLALLVTAAMLAGCGIRSPSKVASSADASSETAASMAPAKTSMTAAKPVDAYLVIGGRIKTCWFNPSDPLFPDHVYRADVSPDGNKVQITIHKARDLGRAGATTYVIDFKQEGRSTTAIVQQNRAMEPEQVAKMRYDIERWKRGDTSCSKDMPAASAAQ